MTREEIRKHQAFLKKQQERDELSSSRYAKEKIPQTGDPCPGCGHQDLRSYGTSKPIANRLKDGLCQKCRRIMQDGLAARLADLDAIQSEKRLYRVTVHGYYDGHSARLAHPDTRHLLGAAMERLIMAVSAGIKEGLFDWKQREGAAWLPSKRGGDYSSREGVFRMLEPAIAEAVESLDQLIRLALQETSDAAKEHGQNLLLQLVAGEMTVPDFNEASLPDYVEGKRRQRR